MTRVDFSTDNFPWDLYLRTMENVGKSEREDKRALSRLLKISANIGTSFQLLHLRSALKTSIFDF